MVLATVESPFAEEEVPEVPLGRTPLISVLFQVRLPMAASKLVQSLQTNQLQTALADDFPFASQQETYGFVMQPGRPPVQQQGPPTWVAQSEAQDWICNLAADSISLTTTNYQSRVDFIERARRLLSVVETTTGVPRASRLGIRYLNRVIDPFDDTGKWIQELAPGARGILSTTSEEDRKNLSLSQSHVLYEWSARDKIQCRWGVLPPDAVIDGSVPPVSKTSWILDIDSFTEGDRPFNADDLAASMETLASRAYRFFRWVVTPESLARFEPRGE